MLKREIFIEAIPKSAIIDELKHHENKGIK